MRSTSLSGLMSLTPSLSWPADSVTSWRVALQAGHWRAEELPEELKSLRHSTGDTVGSYQECVINLDIAQQAATVLRTAGIAVDVLPACIPSNYRADAFVALHTARSTNPRVSGFKIATHWRPWFAASALLEALRATYSNATGLRWDGDQVGDTMRGCYALSCGRSSSAIAPTTPGVVLQMGYLSHPGDRRLMIEQATMMAHGVTNGILRFLLSMPAAGWPTPPPAPDFRATVVATIAEIRSGPGTTYPVKRLVKRDRTLLIAAAQSPWLKLASTRPGESWIRRDAVRLQRLSDQPLYDP